MSEFNVGVGVVVELDIQTREYNLNYQFKYLKSVAESGGIVITISKSSAYIGINTFQQVWLNSSRSYPVAVSEFDYLVSSISLCPVRNKLYYKLNSALIIVDS